MENNTMRDLHFEYYVVEFLHKPFLNVENYVCVPLSWIDAHAYGPTDRRVTVAYPAETLPILEKLVKNKRSPRKGWQYYSALLKFGNDEFREVRKYTANKTKEQCDKLNKNKTTGLKAVVRTSKQTKSLKNKNEKRKLKELRVVIHRIPSLEQSMRKSTLEMSENELNMMRPTVIKMIKRLSDTNNSNKTLQIPNTQQLSFGGIVKKNGETHNKSQEQFCQNKLHADSIGSNKLHLSPPVYDDSQNKSLMADEPNLLQTTSICQKDMAHSKFNNLNDKEEINNSSKSCVNNTLPALYHTHSVINQSTGSCNHSHNSQNSLENENNLESCAPEITNRGLREISSAKQYSEAVNTPPRVSNVSNLARQFRQIVTAVNGNVYSSNYGNSTLQNILTQNAFPVNVAKSLNPDTESRIQQFANINLNNLKDYVKYEEAKQSCQINNITDLKGIQQSTMNNAVNTRNNFTKTSNPQISNPLLIKPYHQEFDKHSNQGKQKTINQKSLKYKYKAKERLLQTSQDVLYLCKMMKNCNLSKLNPSISMNNLIKYTRPLFSYVNQLPSYYGNNTLQSQEQRSKEAYTREDQSSKPQNTVMKIAPPNSQNIDFTYQPIQSMYSLANTKNHSLHAPYNPSTGYTQPTILRENKTNSANCERSINENICIQETLSAKSNGVDFRTFTGKNKTILNNSKSFVVDDPRKIIIKKVIKVKPMKPHEYFPITKNDSLIKEQLKSATTTSEGHVCQSAEKINFIQSPQNCAESFLHKLRIQDIISAEINRMKTSNERTNPKNATCAIFNLPKNTNHNSKKFSEENTTMSVLPNQTTTQLTKLLLQNSIATNDKSMTSSPKTPVFENSTLRHLLLREINYKYNTNKNNYNSLSGIYKPIHTSEENKKIKTNLEQSANKQDKNDDNLKYNKSDNTNDFTKQTSTETDTSKISIIDLCTEKTTKNDYQGKAVKNSDDYNKIRKKRYFSFILPVEYDANNSKWTLKYHTPSFELVELIPGSQVYINKKRLKSCLAKSHNYNVLARRLMLEIFNFNALIVCSYSGLVKNDLRRPGLDETARSVILKYLEEHGRIKGWSPMNVQAVKISMRSKVHELRYKYGHMYYYNVEPVPQKSKETE